MGCFGRKTGGGSKLFTILFCVFSIFRGFCRRKLLPFKDKRRTDLSQINHTKKPTVGFWCFGSYGRIFSVRMKKAMQVLVSKSVARQSKGNREWTQIDANLDCGCLATLKRKDAVIGPCPALKERSRPRVVGQDPNDGGRSVSAALRRDKADRASNGLGFRTGVPRLASLDRCAGNFRKSLIFSLDLRKSLIFNLRLMQVVDFSDIFRYFSCFSGIGENTLGGCGCQFASPVSVLDVGGGVLVIHILVCG
jgi:hypothetical protein